MNETKTDQHTLFGKTIRPDVSKSPPFKVLPSEN